MRSDLKLEVVVIPVADVDRAKRFYESLGWRLDADFAFDNGFRVVQLTPPGSGCSVQFGTKITSAAPGSAQGLYLVVSEIGTARDEFSDPDGNGWLLQEIKTRLPGRGLSNLDVATLTELLQEAEKGHGEYEPTAPNMEVARR